MIEEASVYEVKRVPVEERGERFGLLVLVMRQWPRGISKFLIHTWIKDAGPSRETLSQLRQGLLTPQEFEQVYKAEQLSLQSCAVRTYVAPSGSADEPVVIEQEYPHSPIEHLRYLNRMHAKVTLLCWEAEPPCHRYFLLQLVAGERTEEAKAPPHS